MRETEPTTITKGERIAWTRTFDGYPAAEWSLQYRFRGNGPGIDVDATADGDAFEAAITAAQSLTLIAGERYAWQAWLTEIADTDNTFVVAAGEMAVAAGFVEGSAGAVDLRSSAKQILDAINARLLDKATADQLEYEISTPAGSRRLKRMSIREMLDARSYFAAIVRRERQAERAKRTGKAGRTIVGRLREV